MTVAAIRFAEDQISGFSFGGASADRQLRGFNKSLDTRFFDEPTKIV